MNNCEDCGLPAAPHPLPDKALHENYCWRRWAPGSSFEAEGMRECVARLRQKRQILEDVLLEVAHKVTMLESLP